MNNKLILFLFLCVIFLFATGCSNPHTPAGHEGFVFENPRIFGKGGFRGVIKGPGNYGVSLWRNRVLNIDMRPKTYNENLKILASDDLNITFHFHAVLSINENSVKEVVQKYGAEKWYIRFIKEPFRTFIRNSVQHYTSREIKTKREVISNEVREKLVQHVKGTPFQLVSLVVG
ncbi:MAG: SPFH domain-containing protein, partial [Thermodesulfobacteriota bacterium]|nr:SPFH domain-containing protein [Thermodesulfobacteriota bacterium]